MRSLILDELIHTDIEKLANYLTHTLNSSNLIGVYWLEIPLNLLSDNQKKHKQCSPHQVAIILEKTTLRLELLIRAQNKLNCTCTSYATSTQCIFLIKYFEQLIKKLNLTT